MKHGRILCFGLFLSALGVCASPALAQSRSKATTLGTISGFVHDAAGIPQLGASVELSSEAPGSLLSHQLLTNTQGSFRAENLPQGFYTVKVTLAGFLPTFEKHIHISSNLTTVVRIELESLYASIEQLRRAPATGSLEPDDWKWVLRSASGLRPVLQWHEEETSDTSAVVAETGAGPRHDGRVELTGGARRPGSVSNITGAPGTEFAYDQRIDQSNHVVFAGQVTYDEDSPAGGLAGMWLPTGSTQFGPRSTLVLREAKIGPDGPVFRGMRIDQSGSLTFGERFLLRLGGEYVLVGAGSSAGGIRPRVKWETKLSPNWYLDAVYASLPSNGTTGDASISDLTENQPPSILASALNQLDAFPAVLVRSGKPVLEAGKHEEMAVERKFGPHSLLQVAVFHDDNSHVAMFGRGNDLPTDEFFQDFYSKGFAYDGGSSVSWGTRAALRQHISDDLEFSAIYAFSGALVPTSEWTDGTLRDALRTMPRHSIAMKATGTVSLTKTKLTAGYKWINGAALSRVDPYSEAVYEVSPFLHVGIRQPLPWGALGHWEANADCDNLLAQGYVSVSSREGQMLLVPAFRTFRGGLSLQF